MKEPSGCWDFNQDGLLPSEYAGLKNCVHILELQRKRLNVCVGACRSLGGAPGFRVGPELRGGRQWHVSSWHEGPGVSRDACSSTVKRMRLGGLVRRTTKTGLFTMYECGQAHAPRTLVPVRSAGGVGKHRARKRNSKSTCCHVFQRRLVRKLSPLLAQFPCFFEGRLPVRCVLTYVPATCQVDIADVVVTTISPMALRNIDILESRIT